jgi:hypothetical protein
MVIGAVMLLAVAWGAGLLKTAIGRRVLAGSVVAVVVAAVALPDAIEGVGARFTEDNRETNSRFYDAIVQMVPPLAIDRYSQEMFGIGTGMQNNARRQFGVAIRPNDFEGETPNVIVEQGPIGYVLYWLARLGLIVALLKTSAIFKRAGEGGFRGLAIAYAILLIMGPIMQDHVYSALYFIGVGLLLRRAAMCQPAPALLPPRGRLRPARASRAA